MSKACAAHPPSLSATQDLHSKEALAASKAVASPNDQCDGHGEHGEQHHKANAGVLQGRQICQGQVRRNLRGVGKLGDSFWGLDWSLHQWA
mmetsp:Transcript_5838/g.6535  ORF Transcript_5838/g.6535 Transcript_5838/m.6535 type:complete len:91 (+) Transcript_5838:104-376(+)